MKRNDWLYLTCIALYSFLFYQQTAGLNFFLFSIAIVAALGFIHRDKIRTRYFMVSAAFVLISGLGVYLNGSRPAIAANVSSLLLFAAQTAVPGTSLFVSLFLSVCSVGGAYVFMIVDFFERRAKNQTEQAGGGAQPRKNAGRTWAVVTAIFIVLIFFALYRSSNVLFKALTKHINLDWVSWRWCIFTAIGAVVVYGIFYVRKFGGVGENSNYQRNLEQKEPDPNEDPKWADTLMSEDNERFLGILLFSLLNVLVFFVNGVDLVFQFGDHTMPDGVSYTSYVHEGVGTLIVNVLLAMFLVLFFFRGRLNFNASYKTIRILAIVWLAQNVAMLFFMGGRNNLYTEMFGMTYKRIGVYFYLLLTAIGVITTAVKVYSRKTNEWLFRINTWLFFSVFACSSLVSWSRFVTWYSLYESNYVNRAYLSTMSYQALPYLVELNAHPEKFSNKEMHEAYQDDDDFLQMMDQLSNNRSWGNENDFSVRVYRRVYKQLADYNSEGWRSRTLNEMRVQQELLAFPSYGSDKVLYLEYAEMNYIYYFPGFSRIQRIDIANNHVGSIGQLGSYTSLEEADLSENPIQSIVGIEKCTSLKYINLKGTGVTDLSPLLKISTLQRVSVTDPSSPEAQKLKNLHPNKDLIVE